MRLFYQLSESEQNDVLHHCANLVVKDMIDDGVKLDPISEEEHDLKNKLEEAIVHIKTLSSKEEKTNYLLGDSGVSKSIYDIALEMAKSAFYHDEEELIIFPGSLNHEEHEYDEEENLLPELSPKKPKISPLN